MKIAVLLTCFNRKEKTLKCLSSLFNVIPTCEVFLVDDASTDGTEEAIKIHFPAVHIIKGDGSLFWNRGMHLAWSHAIKQEQFDYYLWLNDDIELYPFFFDELMECNHISGKRCIVSGLIENADKTKILYGGYDEQKKLVEASSKPQKITYMNGNAVLIPQSVVAEIGILDPTFHHDLGDLDYGLRAINAGINVYATRKPIAFGYSNNFCRVRKWNTDINTRFKKLYSPLGSHPGLNLYYHKKHFGTIKASIYWVYIHILNILPDAIVYKIWKGRYSDK